MRILIADQHDLFREGIKSSFQANFKNTFEVIDVSSLEEAQKLLREDNNFDLVLLDADISCITSLQKIGRIKKKHRSVPIVILSSGDDDVDAHSLHKTGVNGLIFKTVEGVEMPILVERILAGEQVFPEIIGSAKPVRPNKTKLTTEANALTARQRDVLALLVQGKSNRDIAQDLDLAEGTVKIHVTAILRTLKVSNRTQAVVKAADFL